MMNANMDLTMEELERAIRENKSMVEMFAESLVLKAAAPGLTKQRAMELRVRRDVCLPLCEVIATNDSDQVAEAAYSMAIALSLLSLTARVPDAIIDAVTAHAKEKSKEATDAHRRMMALGMTIGTKLGRP